MSKNVSNKNSGYVMLLLWVVVKEGDKIVFNLTVKLDWTKIKFPRLLL
jgi:hypothetical protein